MPREDESAVEIDDETDLPDVQFFGKNRMREEFNNSMKAGYIIPEAWDSYAKGNSVSLLCKFYPPSFPIFLDRST